MEINVTHCRIFGGDMTRKIFILLGLTASLFFVVMLFGEPSIMVGWLLIAALIVSLVFTVHFLNKSSN